MSGNSKRVVVLQPRDRKLFSELANMRVVDREQASAVAPFTSTSRANARLLALTEAGYLRRTFVGTIYGGRKAVYLLSKKGIATPETSAGEVSRSAGKSSYRELFLEHQIRVNDIYIWVKHTAIPQENCRFHRWISFTGILTKAHLLIPDGYFEIAQDSAVKSWFLEVDQGTEALRIWQKKIDAYLRFAVSGEFGKLFGQSQFKVLVIAPSDRRGESIRQIAAKSTDKIFRFASFQTINREGFWSSIWQKPREDQRESLL